MQLDFLTASQSDKEVQINRFFASARPALFFANRASTTTGLTFGFYGAQFWLNGANATVNNGTVSLTANATNFIEFDNDTLTVSANTTGFTPSRTPLHVVVTGASSITSMTDARNFYIHNFEASRVFNITTNTTITRGHAQAIIVNNATTPATPIDITIPTDATLNFPIGTLIRVIQGNVSKCNVVASGGVTLQSPSGSTRTRARGSELQLRKVAANTWTLNGDAESTINIFRTVTASTTIELNDSGGLVNVNSASALTVTIPPDATTNFTVGAVVFVRRIGAGAVSIVAGAGVTIRTPDSLNLRKQFSEVRLQKIAANEWHLFGDVVLT